MYWVKSTLVPLLMKYDYNNVLHDDELGLFYKIAPDHRCVENVTKLSELRS